MQGNDPKVWMLAEAVELLEAADRLQRQFFRFGQMGEAPCWEPPIDMYADDGDLAVLVALPGVGPDHFEVRIEGQLIVVRGERAIATMLGPSAILRLEIPYGRFERHIALPEGMYEMVDFALQHGCLRLHLERIT